MPNAPSLCWVFNADFTEIGGAGNRFRAEVRYFASRYQGVNVFCRGEIPNLNFEQKSRLTTPTRLLPIFCLEVFVRALALGLRRKPIVFIVHDPISLIGVGAAAKLIRSARVFLVVHGPMSLEQGWLARNRLKNVVSWMRRGTEAIAYALADRLLVVSERSEERRVG